MQGSIQDRLSRVIEASSPQTNPDGSISGLGEKQNASTTGPSQSPIDPSKQEEEDRQAAIERAKIALTAAREEQTNKLIESGVTLWRSKRGAEALQYFEQALKIDPHNASALYYAGIVYESKKNFPEALACYRKASNEDPTNNDYNDAVAAVQKLMNNRPPVDPKQAEISRLATEAGIAYKQGEFLSALDLYKQLDQKAPNQALVKYNLGTLYLKAQHFHDALNMFQWAVKLRPTDQKFIAAYQQLKTTLDKSENEQTSWTANANPQAGVNQLTAAPAASQPGLTVTLPSFSKAVPPGSGHEPGLLSNDKNPPTQSTTQFSALQSQPVSRNNSQATFAAASTAQNTPTIAQDQHPLVHHPLKSSTGQSNTNNNFNVLAQPAETPVTALGIVATNSKNGVVIIHVGIASRASKAGLLRGDLIRAVDSNVVTSLSQVTSIVSKKAAGAQIDLLVQRKDQIGIVHL
jgi:tetratricopeptide (TPR) repeat protein